ncbi:MAG: AMP-binding protein [Rhodobacteraceae bacterium]|nr:AMP-binding protein [Paracoccaceae bacterium]
MHPDLRLLLSTSGSTGASKFVRLSGENLTSNAASIAEYLEIAPNDRAPTSLPLSYSYGMSILNSHLHAGACVVLINEPVVSKSFWKAFDDEKCTSFAGVPQSFYLLARSGELARSRPALRHVTQAGGKLEAETVRALAETGTRDGWRFFVMYGQTEASPRIAYLPPELASENPTAIGKAIPGGHLWVEGPDGTKLQSKQLGELVYEGPNVMMGYASKPEDLSLGHGPQILKTGDLGFVDEGGLFHITGRASRFLKLSGKRVGLDDVESWLARDGIECVAVGDDDALGLVHTGKASLAPGIAQKLSIPSSFVHDIRVSAIPINKNGKPDLPAMKAMFDTEIKKLRSAPVSDQMHTAETAKKAVIAIFQHQFPDIKITPQKSFEALGGTSIDFVEVELELEAIGISPRKNWQLNTIADLSKRVGSALLPSDRWVPDYASAGVVGTLLVVLLHVIGSQGDRGLGLSEGSMWIEFNVFFEPLRMPLFALLSGFSFFVMGTANVSFGPMSGNLLKRLLLPTAVSIAVFAMFGQLFSTQLAFNTPGQALALLWLPFAHYWFVMSLILITMTSYAVFRLALGKPEQVLLLLAIIFVIFRIQFDPNIWSVNAAMLLMPLFVIGYFYGKHAQKVHEHRHLIVTAAIIVVFSFTAFELPTGPIGRIFDVTMSLAMIALCLVFAGRIPFLTRIAPYAFFIYLWHVLGTSAMRRALDLLDVDSVPIFVAMGMIAGVGFPIVLFRIFGYLPGALYLRGK